MENQKIAKAKPEEGEAIRKCYRRVEEGLPGHSFALRVNESRLDEDIAEGDLLIFKENKRVYGAIAFSSRWESKIFPKKRSYKEEDAILSEFPYQGERVVAIDYVFIDPVYRRKGYGKMLLNHVFHRYEEASFLLLLSQDDDIGFFESLGFRRIEREYDGQRMAGSKIYVRPYSKTGICSDPAF